MSADIVYPLSGTIIGKEPTSVNGNDFVWDEENSQWVLVPAV
jgi:hypothetical protein